ncbi:hypothetical protein [Streptobacillus moniliformis]|uniref:Lipoprotein n=1 Tax=Streptobacillus moniliformis (strain ATCC 14647 / DSM 12112 / NCTC 10651 / 9901) TaxID=519441 RepID=D1AWH6_STRM9|nr:hypothetical protein [Streptobacillus moniliformis]ACZ00652.1 hypothetical protein Smon_0163 [Streptobacillus moniliformis DSM 12112]AVL42824.1 hypothetical protein CEP89_02725 [Streptobacillus moniliformis]QXW65533.1 hypothetical protein KX935_07145 [Streptobacillus moniliformis]SQA14087.1 Uncharacterised protein [Streptobacillus moniliformis]
MKFRRFQPFLMFIFTMSCTLVDINYENIDNVNKQSNGSNTHSKNLDSYISSGKNKENRVTPELPQSSIPKSKEIKHENLKQKLGLNESLEERSGTEKGL